MVDIFGLKNILLCPLRYREKARAGKLWEYRYSIVEDVFKEMFPGLTPVESLATMSKISFLQKCTALLAVELLQEGKFLSDNQREVFLKYFDTAFDFVVEFFSQFKGVYLEFKSFFRMKEDGAEFVANSFCTVFDGDSEYLYVLNDSRVFNNEAKMSLMFLLSCYYKQKGVLPKTVGTLIVPVRKDRYLGAVQLRPEFINTLSDTFREVAGILRKGEFRANVGKHCSKCSLSFRCVPYRDSNREKVIEFNKKLKEQLGGIRCQK